MKKTMWLVVLLVLGGIAAGFYFWPMTPEPEPVVARPPETAPPAPEPAIRHPIPETAPPETPLPPLDSSDDTLLGALTGLFGQAAVQEFFDVRELARRFVVTVDSLPRKQLPMRYRLFKPVAGQFLATGEGENYLSNPDNYRRYKSYVLLADAVDAQQLVAVYTRFYPLFQEEYVNLGYPKGYFNDRLVEAIDDLLAAPEISGSIKLVRPKVMYLYADPALEELSSGQKIMLRMGPENAIRIKARLRELRQALTGQAGEPAGKAATPAKQ